MLDRELLGADATLLEPMLDWTSTDIDQVIDISQV